MSIIDKDKHLPKGRDRIINGIFVFVAGISIFLSALLLPESIVGKNIWLRVVFGIIQVAIAIASAYGVMKFLHAFPPRINAAFIGSWALLAWLAYNILSVFVILPFSASLPLTIAASLVIGLFMASFASILGVTIAARPRIALISILCMATLSTVVLWFPKPPANTVGTAGTGLLFNVLSKLDAPNPAASGTFGVRTFYYGSGTDRHRTEYGTKADLITKAVDASPFVPDGWSVARTSYWGFDKTQLPINGRVWRPDGQGPFPLVLIVHGARSMEESSDAGFGYLGELLASRGYIVASVDENFLNYGGERYGDFEESDIDARGWLLLEHLKVWREWNKDNKSPFYKGVDMDRIALIGHSRGGEAIAAAAAFNHMERYSKNANITFGLNFNIRTLIAFAPSDIYQSLYERTTPLEIKDVNYLLLMGTQDRQVPSILGSRVYQRVSYRGQPNGNCRTSNSRPCNSTYYFKSALYISHANHSQFNSAWGIYDFSWPYRLLSDIDTQLSGGEQRQITTLYVSAFLDATLNNDKRYIPFFRDYRLIESWLPKTAYISRFQDSTCKVIADFDEDIDPETTTVPGGKIIGKNLTRWREQDIDYHYYQPFGTRSNRIVSVEWDAENKEQPILGFQLPESVVHSWQLKPSNLLLFSIAYFDQQTPPNVTVQLIDSSGRVARIPLSRVISLQQPLYSSVTRLSFLEKPTPVTILQTVSIPLSRFVDLDPPLDLRGLREIDFLFGNDKPGIVMIDDVGIEQ